MASWLGTEALIERLVVEGCAFLEQHRGFGRALALRVRTKPYSDDEWWDRYAEVADLWFDGGESEFLYAVRKDRRQAVFGIGRSRTSPRCWRASGASCAAGRESCAAGGIEIC